MLTSMSDRNRKVSSYQRRLIDTVTEEVMMSLPSAFQGRREKAKPHVDMHKIVLQRPYWGLSRRFAVIQTW